MGKISIKILPSIITLGNLFCGFLALAYIADGKLVTAAWLIFAGMIFDVLDGKVARLTKSSSDFGAQLDSLSDMISFGVVPAFLVNAFVSQPSSPFPARMVWVFSLLFVVCAALRLARFNVETDHEESSHLFFKGLATPGASGVVASMVLSSEMITRFIPMEYYKGIMLSMPFILGILMVSNVKYLHVGVHFLKKRRPIRDLVLAIFFIALIAVEPRIFVIALTTAFVSYATFSPVREGILSLRNIFSKNRIIEENTESINISESSC